MPEIKATAFNFNALTVEPAKPLEAMPSGTYRVVIIDGEMRPIKGPKGGRRMNLLHKVDDPASPYNGNTFWDGQNVEHSNAQTKEIAEKIFSSLCRSVNVIDVQDLRQLFNIPVQCRVKFVPETTEKDKTYDAKNEVQGYKPIEGGAPVSAGAAFIAPAIATAVNAPPVNVVPLVAPPVVAPPVVAPVAAFPPAPWQAHPTAPGYFWNTATNATATLIELQALVAASAPPVVAPVVAPPVIAPPVVAPPVVTAPAAFVPPPGWQAHPQSPGYYWNPATGQTAAEDELAAMATAPAVAPAVTAPPVVAAGGAELPPWQR